MAECASLASPVFLLGTSEWALRGGVNKWRKCTVEYRDSPTYGVNAIAILATIATNPVRAAWQEGERIGGSLRRARTLIVSKESEEKKLIPGETSLLALNHRAS